MAYDTFRFFLEN